MFRRERIPCPLQGSLAHLRELARIIKKRAEGLGQRWHFDMIGCTSSSPVMEINA